MAVDNGKTQQAQLLMGAGCTEMNLATVRRRAVDLQQRLAQLQARVVANAAGMGFEALLAEFSVVQTQLVQLQAELRPQLQYYVAHPLELTEANRNLVPEQLASLELPEMAAAAERALPPPAERPPDSLAAHLEHEALRAAQDEHNAAVDVLFQPGGTLHAKSEARKGIAQTHQSLQADFINKQRVQQEQQAMMNSAQQRQRGAANASGSHSVNAVLAALRAGKL